MKIIALASNCADLSNTETTIKSIVYNNINVKIYLFNYDIPQEWFININQYLHQFGSELVNQKINNKPGLQNHMFISEYISENKFLYLDNETIVDHNLDGLFSINFDDNYLLAVQNLYAESDINCGVMLFNNYELKKNQVLMKIDGEEDTDQTIINTCFKSKIKLISQKYNYQLGFDLIANIENNRRILDVLDGVNDPIIYHYLNGDDPDKLISYERFRSKWWFYRNLSWPLIVQKHGLLDMTKVGLQHFDGEVFIFTNSGNVQNLEELVKRLPNVRFNVAAYTEVAFSLEKLAKYSNYHVYTCATNKIIDLLVKKADVYLDINYGQKVTGVINKIKKRKIQILSFNATSVKDNRYENYQIFDDDNVEGMSETILSSLKNKD